MKNDNHYRGPGETFTWPASLRTSLLAILLLAFGFAQAQAVLTPVITPVCQNNDGAVTLNLTGGVGGAYTYYLYNSYSGSYLTQSSPTFTGLGIGSYTGSVRGADSAVVNFNITRSIVVSVQVTQANCPSSNGSIAITATGGTGALTYTWSNGGSGPTISGLAAGRYQVTVSDGSGCVAPVIDTAVTSFSSLVVHISSNGSACAPVLTANVTGASGAVTYLWSDQSTLSTLSVSSSGNYLVMVTDINGCSGYDDAAVTTGYVSLDTNTYSYPDCRGNNGAITIHARNGVAPFTYLWSNGATTDVLTGLGVGQYDVTVTDAAGCIGHDYFYLPQAVINASISGSNNTFCGVANAHLTASGSYQYALGNPTFTYLWSTGATTATINNLAAGSYIVTVTDANGCSASKTAAITDTSTLGAYINLRNPSCGASDGSLNIYAYGGQPNYSVLWSNGSTADSIFGLAAGTYTVTVSDVSGCSSTFSRTIAGHSNMQVSLSTTPTACDTTLYTGTATAYVTGGGTAPYSYTWYRGSYNASHPGSPIGTTQTITGLQYGELVSVVVTDARGCNPQFGDSATISLDASCYDHITGHVYVDSIANCSFDPSERGQAGVYVSANNGVGVYWSTTDASGYYDIAVLPDSYTVSASLNNSGNCSTSTCIASYSVSLGTIGLSATGKDFGINTGSTYDLAIQMGVQGSAPGAQRRYAFRYNNYGQTTVPSGIVTFTYDADLVLSATTPAYASHNSATHTITWNVANILPWVYSTTNQITADFDIPSTVALGTLFNATADISPVSGDCNPANNIVINDDSARASFDPNEKEVSPSGNLGASDTVLTYTIRFQNTGNAPATRVMLKDTLSPYADVSTLHVGVSSHPYDFNLSGAGILTFTFAPIYLPDSSHGDSSKGYVTYTVHTRKNLPLNSQVRNTAYIYFDANPAIVTNTTVSTRSDFGTAVNSINATGGLNVSLSPNPVQDKTLVHILGAVGSAAFTLMDVRGQKVMETSTTDQNLTLEAAMFAPGMYLYTVIDAAGHLRSGKVMIAH